MQSSRYFLKRDIDKRSEQICHVFCKSTLFYTFGDIWYESELLYFVSSRECPWRNWARQRIYAAILCLIPRTTMTSLSAHKDTRCRTQTHKMSAWSHASSSRIRADVMVDLEYRRIHYVSIPQKHTCYAHDNKHLPVEYTLKNKMCKQIQSGIVQCDTFSKGKPCQKHYIDSNSCIHLLKIAAFCSNQKHNKYKQN